MADIWIEYSEEPLIPKTTPKPKKRPKKKIPENTPSFGLEFEFLIAYLKHPDIKNPNPSDPRTVRFPNTKEDHAPSRFVIPSGKEDWASEWSIYAHIKRTLSSIGLPTEPGKARSNFTKWEVTTDGSLVRPGPPNKKKDKKAYEDWQAYDYWAVEVRTPAYYYTEDALKDIRDFCAVMRKNYLIHINKSCGLHVHIGYGLKGFELPHLKRFAALIQAFEPQIDGVHPESRIDDRNKHCTSFRTGKYFTWQYRQDHRKNPRILETIAFLLACETRDQFKAMVGSEGATGAFSYVAGSPSYNFDRMGTESKPKLAFVQDTIECRGHESTLDPAEVTNWVRMLVGMVMYTRDPKAYEFSDLLSRVTGEKWVKGPPPRARMGKEGYQYEPQSMMYKPVFGEKWCSLVDLLRILKLEEPAKHYESRQGRWLENGVYKHWYTSAPTEYIVKPKPVDSDDEDDDDDKSSRKSSSSSDSSDLSSGRFDPFNPNPTTPPKEPSQESDGVSSLTSSSEEFPMRGPGERAEERKANSNSGSKSDNNNEKDKPPSPPPPPLPPRPQVPPRRGGFSVPVDSSSSSNAKSSSSSDHPPSQTSSQNERDAEETRKFFEDDLKQQEEEEAKFRKAESFDYTYLPPDAHSHLLKGTPLDLIEGQAYNSGNYYGDLMHRDAPPESDADQFKAIRKRDPKLPNEPGPNPLLDEIWVRTLKDALEEEGMDQPDDGQGRGRGTIGQGWDIHHEPQFPREEQLQRMLQGLDINQAPPGVRRLMEGYRLWCATGAVEDIFPRPAANYEEFERQDDEWWRFAVADAENERLILQTQFYGGQAALEALQTLDRIGGDEYWPEGAQNPFAPGPRFQHDAEENVSPGRDVEGINFPRAGQTQEEFEEEKRKREERLQLGQRAREMRQRAAELRARREQMERDAAPRGVNEAELERIRLEIAQEEMQRRANEPRSWGEGDDEGDLGRLQRRLAAGQEEMRRSQILDDPEF